MIGYKLISWDIDNYNADLYVSKSENKEMLHHSELKIKKGYYDNTNIQGIYFVKTQNDLIQWIVDCFEWENPWGIDVLEVLADDNDVVERKYDDGRIAYVAEKAFVRSLRDNEIVPDIHDVFHKYFE